MVDRVNLCALLLVREVLQVVVALEDDSYRVIWFLVSNESMPPFLPLFDVSEALDGFLAFECLELPESLSSLLLTIGGYCESILLVDYLHQVFVVGFGH